jgi:hypothetical protein
MVVPDSYHAYCVPETANKQVKNKQEEVPIVVHAETVVHPRTVVVHHEHAPVAHLAVVGASRLHIVAPFAVSLPKGFQFVD